MVFTYQCSTPGYEIYMGRDKYENEDLIAYAFPEDVWFHVSELSSAHVYVRMPFGQTDYERIPPEVVEEACQLTKHNSIEGCKQSEVTIVYTSAPNLKKTASMDTGQVGFKQQSKVKYVHNVKKDKDMIKRLEKTKKEANFDLKEKKAERDRRERNEMKAQLQQQKLQEEQRKKERQLEMELKTYQALQNPKPVAEYKGDGTIDSCRQIEEDFL
ncbi:coiled-coil domain-containing protein 25 [Cyclospora cayetanensis]|uniref:Coiled-coil domain-containing protein 25 n=1 Tax=Cyclospora cayetanensis TaxID=88456 RepID=A0A6P6RTX0_9EIME|nr:coiled-coil domain-containing protein 25 [Cyclospora cayetanensis]